MANTSPDNISYPTNASPKKTTEGHMQDTATSVQTALNTKASLSGAVFTGNLEVSSSGTLINGSNGTSTFTSNSSGKVPVVAKGASGQTANLQEWQNSSGSVIGSIDAGGRLVLPNQPAFTARSTTASIAATQTMPYQVAPVNRGNHYNTSTYRFTAPVAGLYQFHTYNIGSNSSTVRLKLYRNSTDLLATGDAHQARINFSADYGSTTASWLVSANANDYFFVQIYAGTDYGTTEYSWFSGFFLG